MNFKAFSIKGTQTGRITGGSKSPERDRDAKLLSEAICKRVLARRD